MTAIDDAYARAMRKTVLRSDGCAVWFGPLTGSGAPRLEVDGRQLDARRVVLEKHGESLPRHSRLENRCGQLCLNYECIRLKGEDDMVELACSCGQRIKVLRALHRGAYCVGRPCSPHSVRAMTLVNSAALRAAVSAA